ncbi:TrbL/VirB6 family protein [Candidatus Bandiella euplotis]|nr:type IV secretion system protein [Candidatus Bandiella woodruffii]
MTQCIWDDTIADESKSLCKEAWYKNSYLRIKNSNGGEDHLYGEEFRVGGIDAFAINAGNEQKTKVTQQYGLNGTVTDMNLYVTRYPGSITSSNNKINCTCTEQDNPGCKNYNDYHCINKEAFQAGKAHYGLNGVLTDDRFSTRNRLELAHYDMGEGKNSTWYQDNTGGYQLEIDWSGCPKNNGENVQYTVAPKDSILDNSAKWVDITQNDWTNAYLTISNNAISTDCVNDKECYAFLRIKLETPVAGMEENYKYHNTYGQYNVSFVKRGDSNSCSKGLIYDTMNDITDTLVGKRDVKTNQRDVDTGAVGGIFTSVIKKASTVIKLLVTLSLIFSAIAYMVGLVDYNGDAFIKLVLKYAIVLALLTEKSWDFFAGFMVPFFIDGSIELVARYSAESFLSSDNCSHQIIQDPYMIFSIFDGPMSEFTSPIIWKKIWAICTSGLLGFFTAVLLVIAIGYYFVAVVKAIAMFVFALIMDSLLILMSPIFIPCILFSKTKGLFDTWVKYLFSYALQPIFVYTTIIILNFVVIMLISSIFNFTACSVCLIKLNLVVEEPCIISGYQSMMDAHLPPDASHPSQYTSFSSYAMSFIGALAIYIIASAMSQFSTVMAGIASWIITGSAIRHSNVGSVADDTSKYVQAQAQQAALTVASGGSAAAAKAAKAYQKMKQGENDG